MEIAVNGETQTVAEGITIADLLRQLNLNPQRVAVEQNESLVRRAHFAETPISAGDRIEIVTLVGGG